MITTSTSPRLSLCNSYGYLQRCLRLATVFACLTSLSLHAEDIEEKSAQLNTVRTQIEDVKTSMEEARLETDILQTELKKNETYAGSIALNIREIEKQLQQRNQRQNKLTYKKSLHEKALTEQKQALSWHKPYQPQ